MSSVSNRRPARASWVAAEFTVEECELIAYWLSKRLGDAAPRLGAIDPNELKPWLSRLQIHETVNDSYLCRMSGTTTIYERRSDSSDKYLDEVTTPAVYRSCKPMFDRACESGRPLRYRGRIEAPHGGWCNYRRLLLPLRQVDGACDTLLSLVKFGRRSAAANPPPRATTTILGSWELTEADLVST